MDEAAAVQQHALSSGRLPWNCRQEVHGVDGAGTVTASPASPTGQARSFCFSADPNVLLLDPS
eukprot:6349255-Heterocapsa_arctica.AAC.1